MSSLPANDDSSGTQPRAIDKLIAELASEDGSAREKARTALVEIGQPALAELIRALLHKDKQVRWEAAKALEQIGHPAAAPFLVKALADKEFDVRWLAAEGLIVLVRRGVPAILQELIVNADQSWLRQGAHHILNHLVGGDVVSEHHLTHHPIREDGELREVLRPVVDALEDIDPGVKVPVAVKLALDTLRRAPAG